MSRKLSIRQVFVFTALSALLVACGGPSDEEISAAIREVLDSQVEAWNRGDLEGFMAGYLRSSKLSFASGGSVIRGWDTLLERYETTYGEGRMGMLSFTELEIYPLSNESAYVVGKWKLIRENDAPHGVFTLIFRKTPSGWRIVHDHSSGAME